MSVTTSDWLFMGLGAALFYGASQLRRVLTAGAQARRAGVVGAAASGCGAVGPAAFGYYGGDQAGSGDAAGAGGESV